MRPEHEEILEKAIAWHGAGRGAAIATVIETWGSAPRPVGSQLAISGEAELVGSVSGGCVEGAVVAEALEALGDGKCRILEYGISDDDAFAVGLACGGTIRVMVEPIAVGEGPDIPILSEITKARATRLNIALETNTETWERKILREQDDRELFLSGRSGFRKTQRNTFVTLCNMQLQIAIVGGVHIAQPLCQIVATMGMDAAIIDPREAFANCERFPNVRIFNEWPDAALEALAPDRNTAVVTLTHDPKLDDPALAVALRSEAFYIGALGSTRTHAKRVERLTEQGFAPEDIARIDGPVGLDIGAKSPAEIAVSIAAELTERLRRPETRRGVALRPGEAA
jgi:xanthine dehydrogenase accessory factor